MPKITFLPAGKSVEVPRGTSILEAAQAAEVALPHNCGGVCACTTCHIWVERGFPSLPPAGDREEDRLDEAAGLREDSRLGCQAHLGEEDVVVRIPGNRIAS